MEWLALCRSCMVEVSSWELQIYDENAVEMFTFCTNIQVSKDDKLPKQFCYDCIIKIASSYTFIKKAQEVDVTLKNLSREETSVIVKSDNLERSLNYNESSSVKSDFDYSSDVQMDEKDENMITSNSKRSLETKMEIEKLSSPEDSEIEETITNNETDLPEIKPNIEDVDTHMKTTSNINKKKVQKIAVKKKDSNCTRNARQKTNKGKQTEAPESGKNIFKLTTESRKSRGLKSCEKGNKQDYGVKKQFKCDFCEITYKFITGLQKHLSRKHPEATREKRDDKPKVQEEMGANTYPDLKCKEMNLSSKWLPRHCKINNADGGIHYFCPLCPLTRFNTKYNLYYHMKTTHDQYRRFACGECGARFRLGKQLAAHARTHAHARPHVCTKCGMAFKTKSTLTNHMKSHENEKPHLCSVCGFSSKTGFTLKSHMLAHKGVKPFACDECPFRTTYLNSLRLHQRRHRGERRHACARCGKRFYEKGDLDKHMRQVHLRVRPFQCYLCPSAFATTWKCKAHVMRAHGVPLEEIPRITKLQAHNEPVSHTE